MSMKVWLPFAGFLLLVVLFASRIGKSSNDLPLVVKENPVSSAQVVSIYEGQETSLQAFAQTYQKPFLVNIWATWCVTCKQEHGNLMHLAQQGVPIIGVAFTDERAKVNAYLQQKGNPYLKVLDDPLGKVAQDFGVYGTPETYVISADGKILERHVGLLTHEVWQEHLQPVYAAKQVGEI